MQRLFYVISAFLCSGCSQVGSAPPGRPEMSPTPQDMRHAGDMSLITDPTPDTLPPVFGGLTGAAATGNTISLTWTAATDNRTPQGEIVYLIYEASSAGGENFNQSNYVAAAGTTQYTVTGLDARTTYYFVARAVDLSANIDTNVVEQSAVTGDISFSGQVQPVLDACVGCHGGAMPQQGLSLTDAATSYMNLVGRASTECSTTSLVKPGQPALSYLIWKFQGMGTCFTGSQMPPDRPLSAGDFNTVRGWILAGAPNN
jgi:hypothetical protein